MNYMGSLEKLLSFNSRAQGTWTVKVSGVLEWTGTLVQLANGVRAWGNKAGSG